MLLDADRVWVTAKGDARDGAGGRIDQVQCVLIFASREYPATTAITTIPPCE